MRVSRIGNSLVVRVPARVVTTLQLREGDDVEVSAIGVRKLGVEREPDVYELLAKLRRLREARAVPEGLPLERLLLGPAVGAPGAPTSSGTTS
jgi:antitoxin MazE